MVLDARPLAADAGDVVDQQKQTVTVDLMASGWQSGEVRALQDAKSLGEQRMNVLVVMRAGEGVEDHLTIVTSPSGASSAWSRAESPIATVCSLLKFMYWVPTRRASSLVTAITFSG